MPIVTTPSKSVPIPSGESDWRQLLASAVRDPIELCQLLGLPSSLVEPACRAAGQFPLLVPRPYIERMRRGDPDDPLLKQVLPLKAESDHVPGFVSDPVGENQAICRPGLLKKYESRALMITTPLCGVHCRYCFRRHFAYQEVPRSLESWQPALDAVAGDPSIDEIILSGGDPLTLDERRLIHLVEGIERVPHVRRLRFHTRLPIVIPQRITPALLHLLQTTRLKTVVVVHTNHPAELDTTTSRSLRQLVSNGIVTLNQSVLLRGVNDAADVLIELSRTLVGLGVLPYYLHQLDPVDGAAHFHVSAEQGRELVNAMRRALPGYAVPRYVRESSGAPYKLPLA